MKTTLLLAALSTMIFACADEGFTAGTDSSNCRPSDIVSIYQDNDMDGDGDPETARDGCVVPAGFSGNGNDCDDTDPLKYGGATDFCGDRIDNDCSGSDTCADNLVGGWSFVESSGEIVSDDSGNVLNGSMRNGLLHSADATLTFDGADDYLEFVASPVLQSDAGTIAFWFMPSGTGVNQAIISRDSQDRDAGGQYTIYWDEIGVVRAKLESRTLDYEVVSSPLPANQWHHVAFSFGGNEGMSIVIDDIDAGKDPYTGGASANLEPLIIGANTDRSGNGTITPLDKEFGGKLAAVQIYNRQLSRAEVTSLKLITDPRTSGL